MNSFKLRTVKYNQEIHDHILKGATHWIVAEEEGGVTGKIHYHWFIHTSVKPQALRVRCRKYFKGNEEYNLSSLDEDFPIQYLAYNVKDRKHTFSDSFTEEQRNEILKYDMEVKAELSDKPGKKKKKVIDMVQEYIENNEEYQAQDEDHKKMLICRLVVQYHLDNDLLMREFQLQSYALTITARLFPDYAVWTLPNRIYDKVWNP